MDWYTNLFNGKQVWFDGDGWHLFYKHNEGGYYSSGTASVTANSSATNQQQAEDYASTQRFIQILNEAGIQTERTNSRSGAIASWITLGALPEIKGLSSLLKIFKGTSKNVAKRVDELLAAAKTPDKSGLTAVGRQLQKHGSRHGSAYPKAVGPPEVINAQGEAVLRDILTNPSITTNVRHHARFGEVIEFRIPGGTGARFSSDGKKFLGFLEP
jgi:hypothetical protein